MRTIRVSGALLAILAATSLLAACGGAAPAPTQGAAPKSEPAAAPQPTAAPKPTAAPQAQPQAATKYPEKAINLIVAYGAGGGTDVTARLLAADLQKVLGQPVTVTNVEGGGGWTGWGQLAHATPDGYTIGYVNVPNMFAGYLDPQIKRPENLSSFIPIMNHVTDPCVWIVKADSRFKDLQSTVAEMKAQPDKVSMATHGAGGDDDLALRQVKKLTGAQPSQINNDSTAKSMTQLLGGHVDVVGCNVSEVVNQYKNKEVRVLGVMGEKRSEYLPDVPTFKEQGIDVTMSVSRGIAVPAKTPSDVVKVLSDGLQKAVASDSHKQKAKELALSLDVMTGDQYLTFLKGEEQKNKELMGW
jgi:tripartite-type tricarboxylate transporter receptor subunit TctC